MGLKILRLKYKVGWHGLFASVAEPWCIYPAQSAEVAKLADATALGAVESNLMGVQISPSALCVGRASPDNPFGLSGR